jgi:hypothetical protein
MMAKEKRMPSAVKLALEDMLRTRRLQADAPPLRGEDRRLTALGCGVPEVDGLIGGGFPRGQVSEVHGPASSGRTGLVLSLVARVTSAGGLAAWVDPADRLDPVSAGESGTDLARLLWLRGDPRAARPRTLMHSVSAAGTLLGSGLFEAVVLDLVGTAAADLRRLPGTTWLRLQRTLEDGAAALVLLADHHVAQGPRGVSLALRAGGTRWSGAPGPGRLLRGLCCDAQAGRHGLRRARFELQTGDA